MVGAILTQNTAWNNAASALASLRAAGKLDAGWISRAAPEAIGRLIRSSGFFRQKARRLRDFSRYILQAHPEGLKKWFSSSAPETLRAELLELNGIGPETADSMILYAGQKPKFVVDAYTARIFGRVGLLTGGYEDMQAAFELALPRDHSVYNEYHALIVALGKDHCRKTAPRCAKCPLRNVCRRGKTEIS